MEKPDVATDLLVAANGQRFATVLADPPWRFMNRTGKMAPEHPRHFRNVTELVLFGVKGKNARTHRGLQL